MTTARNAARLFCLRWALLLVLLLTHSLAGAADLNVDTSLANSPYAVGGNINFTNENVGITTTGTINQTGGAAFTNTVTNILTLGVNAGSSGTYNLSIGTLTMFPGSPEEVIGSSGTGTFNQLGGTHTVSIDLVLGHDSGGSGTYNLSGGSLSAGKERVGLQGSGIFTQSGGTNTLGNNLILGETKIPRGSGVYNLSGGALSAANEYVGFSGNGTFTQSGGTNSITMGSPGGLFIGFNPSAVGTYNLSGGNLAVTGDEYVGWSGSGAFNQTGGTHTVGGDLLLGVNPGASGTYALLGGNLSVGGKYTQSASSTLAVGIASAANYEKIPVGGTASLNGTVAPVLLGGYIPKINQLFPGVITTVGGVTGTFNAVANQFITPILYWQPIYTATTFDLLVKGNFNNPTLNLTHNQANVGNMLNGLANTATGDLANILNAIANLPSNSNVANAYQQISADKAAALSTLAFAGANLQQRTLSRRITDLRFGNRETGTVGGLPGSFNVNLSRESGLMLAYNSSSLAGLLTSKSKTGPAAPESRWGLYLDPAMIMGAQRSSVDQTGFNFTIAGFNAGADYRVRDNLLVGLATGYRYTGARFQGSGGSVEANTWPLTAYVAYLPETFYAYGSLGYALNLFNLGRGIGFNDLNRTARSSTTGNQFNAYGEAGYDLKVKRLVVTPLLSLAYSKLWVDGFTEDGAGALNLKVSPQNAQSLQTGLGAKVAAPLKRGPVTVVPQVYAIYQHEYSNSSRTLNAHLSQEGNPCVFQTDSFTGQPHRNFAVLGANVNILTQKNLKVQLDYNAEVGRGNYTAHYVSAGVRWEF